MAGEVALMPMTQKVLSGSLEPILPMEDRCIPTHFCVIIGIFDARELQQEGTIMTINLGIPQLIWLVMAGFGLIVEIINHGKPREPHNAYTFAISVVISFLLLYWGGFFG